MPTFAATAVDQQASHKSNTSCPQQEPAYVTDDLDAMSEELMKFHSTGNLVYFDARNHRVMLALGCTYWHKSWVHEQEVGNESSADELQRKEAHAHRVRTPATRFTAVSALVAFCSRPVRLTRIPLR